MRLIKRIFIKNCLILALLFSLNACASFYQPKTEVDPDFKEFITEFKHISSVNEATRYEDMSIVFSKENKGEVIGTCYENIFYKKVEISEDFWMHSNHIDKQALIYHELGHCVCNLKHSDVSNSENWLERIFYKVKNWILGYEENFEDGCPTSWMNSSLVPSECSYRHFEEYVQDMKNRCQ